MAIETISITYVKNPFDPINNRVIEKMPVGLRVKDYLQAFGIGDEEREVYDIAISINGQLIIDPLVMDLVIDIPYYHLAFCHVPKGEGKNPLALIAMLAVIIAAPYLTEFALGYSAGGSALEAMAAAGGGSYMTSGLVLAGGLIVSSVFKPSIPGFPSIDSSSTYSWDVKANAVSEGQTLPVLYGTVRVAPPIIGRYLETAGDRQYLNVLLGVAAHELDSITLARLNQTSINNFFGITEEIRLGSSDQAITQGFDDTRTTTSVASKLNHTASAWSGSTTYAIGNYCTYLGVYWQSLQNSNLNNIPSEGSWWTEEIWITRTTSGNTVQGITICLSFPSGLFRLNSSNEVVGETVEVYFEYKKTGDVSWTRLNFRNSVTTQIISDRWSAGHWEVGESVGSSSWVEVLAGGSTPSDHVEGDPYAPTAVWYSEEGIGGPTIHYLDTWHWLLNSVDFLEPGVVILDYDQITAAQSKPLRRTYFADNLPAGEYELRCRFKTAPTSGDKYINDCYWEYFEERVYDDFRYPGTSLYAIRALATDQLSGGIPRIDILATRSNVSVWTGAAYENKPANNPAWAAYDILHNSVYGSDVPYSRIDYAAFASWASYCTTEGFTVNIYFDQAMNVRKALDIIGQSGRANVVQMGSKFTVIIDKIDISVQKFLFTVGNMGKDSFSEEFLPLDDRSNSIEITYFDADLNYEPQIVEVTSDDFDTTDRDANKRSITLYGCTDRDQALRYAKFLLKCNRYLTLTASWSTDVDALACMPGDVVEVSHDVPQWGFSGRIVSATANTVTLDRSVTIEVGKTYVIGIKHQDDDTREEKNVSNSPGTYTELTISTNWSSIPVQYALYAFGETDLITKQFRISKISRNKDSTFKIIGIEYVEEVYDDVVTVPTPPVWTYLDAVHNLSVSERYTGGTSTNALISWSGSVHLWYIWYKSTSMDNPMYFGNSGVPWVIIPNLDYGLTYTFYVSGTPSIADASTASLAIAGRLTLPAISTPVFVSILGGFQRVRIEWESIDNEEYDMVEVWRSATNDRTVATKVGEIHSSVFVDTNNLLVATTYYYWIRTRSLIETWSDWESGVSAGHSVTTGGVITGDFTDDFLELELMKINFQNISWAQFAIFDSFENSTKRASPDPSTYDARINSGSLDNGEDATASREFGFVSKTYADITTVLSSDSTSVGLNFLEDTAQSWFTDECKNLTLYDSTSTAFTVTGNDSNTLTVVGTPAAGAYTLVDGNPGYAVAFASFLDSTNGGAGYVKLEVSFNNGSNYQTFLDTEGGVDLLGGTVAIANSGNDYIARITLKNDGSGNGPMFYKWLVCTDPSPWRF